MPWPRATAGDHGIHYVGRDLASWSRDHIREIADVGGDYGLDPDASPVVTALTAPLVERFNDLLGPAARIGHAPAGRPARRALPGCRCVAGLGVAGPSRAGCQRLSATRAGTALPSADAATDAVGPRDAARTRTPNALELEEIYTCHSSCRGPLDGELNSLPGPPGM